MQFKFAASFVGRRQFGFTVLPLCLALALLLLADHSAAQMTFSDGWGKRSGPVVVRRSMAGVVSDPVVSVASPLRDELTERDAILEARQREEEQHERIDECHRRYLHSVAQLHEQIMHVYGSYERCQSRAIIQPSAGIAKALRG